MGGAGGSSLLRSRRLRREGRRRMRHRALGVCALSATFLRCLGVVEKLVRVFAL